MKRITETGRPNNGFRERGEPWIPCGTCGHPMDAEPAHREDTYLLCRLCGLQWRLAKVEDFP